MMAIATEIFRIPRPMMAAITIASGSPGKAYIESMTRTRIRSNRPPTTRRRIVAPPLTSPPAMAHLISDARIHERVHDVDEEADDDHQNAVVDDRPLDRGIIAVADRIEHKPAHAFEREDGLRQDGPAEQQREREAHRRDNRDEGVLQRVPEEYRAFRNPPRACRLHEIRAHRLDHVDARNANEESR